APAHAVVSGAEGAADDDGEFGDAGAGDGGDHFRAVFGDAAGFVVAAHHEPGDVLQEDEGDGAPVAQFDEVGAFERGFGEQDAVVGDDADGVAVQVREPGDEGGPVVGFEFGEFAGVDEPCDDFPHVVGGAGVGGDDAVQFRGVGCGGPGFAHVPGGCGPRAEGGDDAADDGEGVCVVVGDVVDDSGDAGVDVAAAEFFRGDDFAGGGFHERGPAEEDGALVADDDGFVAHGGHVGAAGSAGAEDRGDLRDAALRHGGLVVEDAAEVVAVGEDFVLHGQERAAGVDEVDARQVVVQGDFLGAEVFFDGHRIVAAAFDGGVVGDDEGFASGEASDGGDDPCGGCGGPVGRRRRV